MSHLFAAVPSFGWEQETRLLLQSFDWMGIKSFDQIVEGSCLLINFLNPFILDDLWGVMLKVTFLNIERQILLIENFTL